jgi:hypothetical protein
MRKLLTLHGICSSVFGVHGRVTLQEKGRQVLTSLHGFFLNSN